MFSEKVFTIEEISQHLRVPEDAILSEVTAGTYEPCASVNMSDSVSRTSAYTSIQIFKRQR